MSTLTLPKFLDAISISGATVNTWNLIIAEGYDTLDTIRQLTIAQIAEVGRKDKRTIGEKRAFKIHTSLNSGRIQDLLDRASVWMTAEQETVPTEGRLKIDVAGKNICATGTAPIPRNELKGLLTAAGARFQSGVTGTTDILLTSDPDSNSGKTKKARQLGKPILAYEDALNQ